MLKSRSYLRSLLSFSSTNYYQNSHHCGCSSLMSPTTSAASAAMAASASSFTATQRDNFSYVAALSSKNTAKINSIRLKGSSSDNHNINQNHDHCSSGSINGNRLQKARSYAPSLTPLLRCTEASNPSRVIDRGNGGPHQRGSLIGSSPKNGERFVVAVDVDEVLGNFVSALNQFIADRYSLNHSVSEYHVYEFFKIWNCSRNEADIRVHEFFKTSYFKKGIHPIPGAKEALQKLSRFCNLSIVTSRQNAIKDHTVEWIEKYYPGIFQEIHFGNHFALDGTSRPKSDICRSLGAHILIDDNPRYAIECANEGMKVLLFDFEDSYPWSKMESIDQHPLVTKVVNWKEVENQIASWVIT